MSKPKTLKVFDRVTEDTAYNKLNNYVEVTKDVDSIKLTLDRLEGNPMITFKAPCNCEDISYISVGKEKYELCDTTCNPVKTSNVFVEGSLISVLLDSDSNTKRAYIQSGGSGDLDSKADKLNPTFPENITVSNTAIVNKLQLGDMTITYDSEKSRIVIH